MRRTTRLEQVQQILLDHPEGLRVIEISELCGVDRRTIYRDLEVLQEIGIPIWQTTGRYGIEREQYLTNIRVNLNEAFTLLWAMRLFMQQSDIRSPHAASLITKLKTAFTPEIIQQIDALAATSQPQSGHEHLVEIIEGLARAWADSFKVRVWYKSQYKNKPIRLIVAPYVLDSSPQGKLYMIGVEELSRDVHIFNVGRITRLEVLEDQPFERNVEIDFGAYLEIIRNMEKQAKYDLVILRFEREVVPALRERQWYTGQRIEPYDDGGCIFSLAVEDWREIEQWVRSWGAQVEVIAPSAFRARIAAEFKQAARLYS